MTGLRRVAALGNVGPTNRAVLINLPKGTYYWSVQAIDTAFAGSRFALHDKFQITNALPSISDDTEASIRTHSPFDGLDRIVRFEIVISLHSASRIAGFAVLSMIVSAGFDVAPQRRTPRLRKTTIDALNGFEPLLKMTVVTIGSWSARFS